MATKHFFPGRPNARPMIYAYKDSNPRYAGMLKVGYTTKDVKERVAQQYPTLKPGEKPYRIVFEESAVRSDGTSFMDHDVHKRLERRGFRALKDENGKKTEWFKCTVDDVRAAWMAVQKRIDNTENRTQSFRMRPEQQAAVEKTFAYYSSVTAEGSHRTPRFLWNAKMRFGKTFAAYQLAKKMNAKRVLVLTFKPAVKTAWEEDLMTHLDFEGWQFVTREGMQFEQADPARPIVCFGSFQDFLGRTDGRIKARNEWVHLTEWDLVIFDEYHFGAWNENSKNLFAAENEDEKDTEEEPTETGLGKANTGNNDMDEGDLPIVADYYLFLSGTPFRALNSGEFIEEQVYNWTYSDEQRAKRKWPMEHPGKPNPYESLPRMVMLTYQMPEDIRTIALGGEFDTFDLNIFFEARGEGDDAEFVLKDHVQKWLDIIRGQSMITAVDELKQGAKKPPLPYSDANLLSVLNHTVWYLPRVNACYAMRNLLRERQNTFYHDYTINVCAGAEAGIGAAALEKVQDSMEDPLESKSITLTCGKLTTGVTVKPWTGIFMLTNMRSPETYFQAAFRVQSPWVVDGESGKEIIKRECYVFDFALDRSLRMVSNYSLRLSVNETGPEQKVGEFIDFLPVLAYDGSSMRQVSASEILDIAMAGTSATLLARRWESALLVNVDNETLRRLIANEKAMEALMNIEGFRALNKDGNILETIVNRTDAVKKAKREIEKPSKKEKKELTAEEKELKTKRKQVQEKLIKFATRIPVFMYLTDFREECLKDVITHLEPGLFKKVTGLSVEDFELLVSLGVFNDGLMNDAVYKFRRYEDASLSYAGINRHEGEKVGLFDTTLSEFDYLQMKQEESLRGGNVAEQIAQTASSKRKQAAEPAKAKPGHQKKTAHDGKPSPHKPVQSTSTDSTAAKGTTANETEEPAVSPKQIQALEEGDRLSHKAFGYGTITEIGSDRVKVVFEDSPRQERTFLSPATFNSGILAIV